MTAAKDYSHSKYAETNRRRKADALAAAAAHLGLQPFELTLVGGTVADAGRRKLVRKAAGLDRDASVETWSQALGALEQTLWRVPGTTACPDCGWPIRVVTTATGKRVALDPLPREDGSVYRSEVRGKPVAVVVAGHDTVPDDEPLYRQHARSCPKTSGRARAEAPKCTECGHPLDGVLAARDATYTMHPACARDP
ncbi:hypothetical protein [Actinotalea sp. JY-7876]|uniref:hypothetical protein n=1 Tax=Actinotalea sp. JY-7876 TaxID=2758442 RepID=UPI0015F3E0E8|nr:hypothetical protein [Actinotalea sp. JY-7876]